jgi:hypothetical protein
VTRAPASPRGGSRAAHDLAVVEGLAKRAVSVARVAPGSWSFELANGARFGANARLDDEWLLLDAPLHPAWPPWQAVELLADNARLPGGARFAVRAADGAVHVRAEVPIDAGVDLARRVVDVCAGFAAAKTIVTRAPGAIVAETDGGLGSDGADLDLPALCRETGWPFHERAPGRLVVDLDVGEGVRQAAVEAWPGGGVSVGVPIASALADDDRPASPSCRDALALLLLRTCGTVRMARATAAPDGREARFEVAFASEPAVAELAHAFAALSVACRVTVREAAVLRHDDAVARLYLEQWDRAHTGCAR